MPVEQPYRFSQKDFADRADDPDASARGQAGARGNAAGPEALHRAKSQLEELAALVRFYAAAKWDTIVASFRRTLVWAALGLVAGVAGVAIVATAAVLTVLGLADLLAMAMGDRPWAGALVTGIGLLSLIFGAGWLVISRLHRRFRERTMHLYAQRHAEQRAQFGHDVAAAARQDGARRS